MLHEEKLEEDDVVGRHEATDEVDEFDRVKAYVEGPVVELLVQTSNFLDFLFKVL